MSYRSIDKAFFLATFLGLAFFSNIHAAYDLREQRVPLRAIFDDADIAVMAKFLDKPEGFFCVDEVIYSKIYGAAETEAVIGSYFALHEGEAYGSVGTDIDYKSNLSSQYTPETIPDVSYLLFLKQTSAPSGERVMSLKPNLILPALAASYQFVEGEYAAIPLLDFSTSQYPDEVNVFVEKNDAAFKAGKQPFSGSDVLRISTIDRLERLYRDNNGVRIAEAYLGILKLIQSDDPLRRKQIFRENSSNHVFVEFISEVLEDIELDEGLISSASAGVMGAKASGQLSIIDQSHAGFIIRNDLRENLNAYKIQELSLEHKPLREVVETIASFLPKQDDGLTPILSFLVKESAYEPNVSVHCKGLKLGDILWFMGNTYHVRFDYDENENTVVVEPY